MSRPWLLRAVVGVVLGVAAVFAYQQMFPSEETRIRRQLDAIAREASELSNDPSGFASAARFAMYFTDDVTIDPGGGVEPLRGRETIFAAGPTLRSTTGQTEIDVRNADVRITPDGNSAAVTVTVAVKKDAGSGRETLDARELALTMTRRESVWLISHVTAVDTLR
jgi:hypothetical protein